MYQVSLKSEGICPLFVITWPGITLYKSLQIFFPVLVIEYKSSVHYNGAGLWDSPGVSSTWH